VASTTSDTAGNGLIQCEVAPNGASDFQSYSSDSPTKTLKTKHTGVKLVCKLTVSEVPHSSRADCSPGRGNLTGARR
jgi:hypothetical protein